jgi:glycosyltransferase involved in cell wall biosynthesis
MHQNGRTRIGVGSAAPALAVASSNGVQHAPRVSVVIPTLNEAENLPHVLPKLPRHVYEVILVDGRSTDGTVEIARALYPEIRVLTQSGRGKGDALACGFAAARGDIVVMLDADGSTRPEEIPLFVDALVRGADMAKGSRFADGGGSADITRLRQLGNRVIGGLVNFLYGTHYTDLCYGYNAFWRRPLSRLRLDCAGFEVETLINVRAAKAGLHVVEVPSFEDPRIHGASNLRAFRDGWRILRLILRERFRRAWPAIYVVEPFASATATPVEAAPSMPTGAA